MLIYSPLFLLFTIGILCIACESNLYSIYVSSKHGDDLYNGLHPRTPFRSIQRAKQHVRTIRDRFKSITVTIMSGEHHLHEPLVFTREDSGEKDHPIVWRGFDSSVITGCHIIPSDQWKKTHERNMTFLQTTLPATVPYFHSLFVNQKRKTRARSEILTWEKNLNGSLAHTAFVYHQGNISDHYKNLDQVNVAIVHSWTVSWHYVKSIIPENRTIVFTNPSDRNIGNYSDLQSGRRYWIENAYELLDEPGEWYYDQISRMLTYIPLENELSDLKNLQTCVPVTLELIKFENVQHVHFENLKFHYTDWLFDRQAMNDGQAANWLSHATVYLNSSSFIVFDHVEVAHVGEYAIHCTDGCSDILIRSCNIFDMGGGGVRIGRTIVGPNIARRVTVETSTVLEGGRIFPDAVGNMHIT
jgi:hypothetical protein